MEVCLSSSALSTCVFLGGRARACVVVRWPVSHLVCCRSSHKVERVIFWEFKNTGIISVAKLCCTKSHTVCVWDNGRCVHCRQGLHKLSTICITHACRLFLGNCPAKAIDCSVTGMSLASTSPLYITAGSWLAVAGTVWAMSIGPGREEGAFPPDIEGNRRCIRSMGSGDFNYKQNAQISVITLTLVLQTGCWQWQLSQPDLRESWTPSRACSVVPRTGNVIANHIDVYGCCSSRYRMPSLFSPQRAAGGRLAVFAHLVYTDLAVRTYGFVKADHAEEAYNKL